MEPFTHESYIEAYTKEVDFKEVYQQIRSQIDMDDGDNTIDYHLQNELLYRLDKLCVPKCKQVQLFRGSHL